MMKLLTVWGHYKNAKLVFCLGVLSLVIASNLLFAEPITVADIVEEDALVAEGAYRLFPLDQISIQVFGEKDLSTSEGKSQRIDARGFVNIPLLGDVKVVGKSAREAELMIEKLFVDERYLVNPQVSIDVEVYFIKKVSVLGEVNKPGAVEFREEANFMDIVEVIAHVGGFTGVAKSSEVHVTRIDENGEKKTFVVDVIKIIRGQGKRSQDKTESFEVFSNDTVFVPERLF